MTTTISIRPAVAADIGAVLGLWREAAAPTTTDDADGVAALLEHDPGALLVAESSSGQIVGTVIAGWDGWRGSIYRIVVVPEQRRAGLGRRLLGEAEDRLRRVGARRMHAIVVGTDERAAGFWRASDWEHQSTQWRFTQD
ncbi:MAG TPA: GNAT family N-acetyltransferase [Acidimicrobiales bacterium]